MHHSQRPISNFAKKITSHLKSNVKVMADKTNYKFHTKPSCQEETAIETSPPHGNTRIYLEFTGAQAIEVVR